MKAGLYRVTTPYLCAGFVVKNGVVTECAPILCDRIEYWKKIAVLVIRRIKCSSVKVV